MRSWKVSLTDQIPGTTLTTDDRVQERTPSQFECDPYCCANYQCRCRPVFNQFMEYVEMVCNMDCLYFEGESVGSPPSKRTNI